MKTRSYAQTVLLTVIVCAAAGAARARQQETKAHSKAECPMHDKHTAELIDRGGRAMGFDQEKSTHHFRLTRDGGAIEVEANDAKDTDSRDQIRQHLKLITKLFAEGDFSKPFAVHGRIPPGVDTLTKLKAAVSYIFEETEKGGLVRIATADSAALKAVHEFLRFQIKDHFRYYLPHAKVARVFRPRRTADFSLYAPESDALDGATYLRSVCFH